MYICLRKPPRTHRLSLALAIALSQALLPASAHAWSPVVSEMKAFHWFQSTLIAGIAEPLFNRSVSQKLPVPGTSAILNTKFWKSQSMPPRGLILILPGTGGDSTSGIPNVLAEGVTTLGFDAMVLTNPFSAAFQSTFSADGLIGFPQRDAADTERMLQAAIDQYTQQYGEPRELDLIGSSLGGLYTVLTGNQLIAKSFHHLIALNPPVGFAYAMSSIDQMIAMSVARRPSELGLIYDLGEAVWIAGGGVTLKNIARLESELPGNEQLSEELIGESFQETLIEITRGLYKVPSVLDSHAEQAAANATLSRINFTGYFQYLDASLAKMAKVPEPDFSTLANAENLLPLLRRSRNLAKIHVITNQDDFLLQPTDLNQLDEVLHDHLHVFEAGGHCGNYWSPSYQEVLSEILL